MPARAFWVLMVAAIAIVVPSPASAQGADLAVARKCFDDIWVRHNTTAVARCNAASIPDHSTAGSSCRSFGKTNAVTRR